MNRVLLVDDDPQIVRAVRVNLSARGYTVTSAYTGRQALAEAVAVRPDVVVLDLGLPDLDGVAVITDLRRWTPVPIVVLSGRAASGDKVEALDAGADDYVTKPFGMNEFLARLRAAARRGGTEAASLPTVRTADFVLDFANYRATRADVEIRLTPTEWRLLSALAATPGQLVTHTALLHAAWGPTYGRESNYLRVYANQLRRKLEPDTGRPRYLITEPGIGYRLMV